MIYELRIYRAMPGKLPALVKRFEEHTLKYFERHGIRQAGFWTTQIGPSHLDFYYMLQWESLGERDAKWAGLQKDPDWVAARNASEVDGPLTQLVSNMILQPTAFSSVK